MERLFDCDPKKAQLLIKTFKTPEGVIEAIRNTEIERTRSGDPKGIRGDLKQVKGFSWRFVERNQRLLFGESKSKFHQKALVPSKIM